VIATCDSKDEEWNRRECSLLGLLAMAEELPSYESSSAQRETGAETGASETENRLFRHRHGNIAGIVVVEERIIGCSFIFCVHSRMHAAQHSPAATNKELLYKLREANAIATAL
jgi:hypothetical protein